MYKLQDLVDNVDGPLFWPAARAQKMVDDVYQDWLTNLAAMDAATDIYSKSSSIFYGVDVGVSSSDNAYSWYMLHEYGGEGAYMLASAGKPEALERLALNLVLRFKEIGGALGYFGPDPIPQGFRLFPSGSTTLPYANEAEFVTYVTSNASKNTADFNTSPAHYIQRAYWVLKYAQDAVSRGWISDIPGLDDAVDIMWTDRGATSSWIYTAIIAWKHGGIDFTTAGIA